MGPALTRRLATLCDPASLEAPIKSSESVFVTGWAEINRRKVMVIATDPDPLPEPPNLSLSSSRYIEALQQAGAAGRPVVFLHDSPASYQSGRTAFQGTSVGLMMGENSVGKQYYEIARLSGKVPLVCAVFGRLAQAQAFPTVMCDGMVMLKDASISVARPDAVAAMLKQEASYGELGGARMHSRVIGDCHQVVSTEDEAFAWIRRFLSYLPSHANELPPSRDPVPPKPGAPGIGEIVPAELNHPFDVRRVIDSLVDENQFLELSPDFAGEAVTGFSRIDGQPAGIVANNPMVNGGVLFRRPAAS
jgi:acetyl-CoA carboxylase carboxyltransferase component